MSRVILRNRLDPTLTRTIVLPPVGTFGWSGRQPVTQVLGYVPPIGIPAPSFGINEIEPADPGSWPGSETAGYYYVDPTVGGATDTQGAGDSTNPRYGYPNKPRLTIPNNTTFAAGSKIVVASGYTISSDRIWISGGTSGSPVWIVNKAGTTPVLAGSRQAIEMRGTYLMVKGLKLTDLKFRFGNVSTGGNASFMSLNGLEISGYTGTSNSNIISALGASGDMAHDLVVYNCNVHNNGNRTSGDLDVHGAGVGAYVYNYWILDSIFHHNAGDGVQFGTTQGAAASGSSAIGHHYYCGRCISYANQQNGYWCKDGTDVIFSENEAYGHVAGTFSPGTGGGHQYAPQRIWWIFNNFHDNEGGIQGQGDGGTGAPHTSPDTYIIGNRIVDNYAPTPGTNIGDSRSGITLRFGANRYILFNTIWGCDSGTNHNASGVSTLDVTGNIIGGLRNTAGGGADVYTEVTPSVATVLANNVFDEDILHINHANETIAQYNARVTNDATGCTNATPTFVDLNGRNMRLDPADTVAKNQAGTAVHAAFDTFFSLYGIDIAKDILGVSRPQGTYWDMGAYEST